MLKEQFVVKYEESEYKTTPMDIKKISGVETEPNQPIEVVLTDSNGYNYPLLIVSNVTSYTIVGKNEIVQISFNDGLLTFNSSDMRVTGFTIYEKGFSVKLDGTYELNGATPFVIYITNDNDIVVVGDNETYEYHYIKQDDEIMFVGDSNVQEVILC